MEKHKLENIIKFVRLMKPYKRNIVVFCITHLTLIIISLPLPWLSQILVDHVMLRQNISLLVVILLSIFLISAMLALLSALNQYYITYVHHAMSYDIRSLLFDHLMGLSFSFYNKKEIGDIQSRLMDGVRSRELLISIITTIIKNLFYFTIIPIILILINWKLAIVALLVFPWITISFIYFSPKVRKYSKFTAEKRADVISKTYEFLSNVREIQAIQIEDRISRRMKNVYLKFRKVAMIFNLFGNLQQFASSMLTAIGTLAFTWYGTVLVIDGEMTVGTLLAFTSFIGYLTIPLRSSVGLMTSIQEVIVCTERFNEYLDIQSEIKDPKNPIKINNLKGDINFSEVKFSYQEEKTILCEINLSVPAGSTVAIVGETGAGKTTLLNLLPRFYENQKGFISIDGIDIRDVSIQELRSKIGIVRQNPSIFFGSIQYNITGGRNGYSRNKVIEAAKMANAHEFISSLPNGYETIVGENGTTLSGGEAQRVALARIFILDRPIFIFDESTSSVDRKTDALIQNSIKKISKGRTTFIIAHRLITIKDSDIIVVMKKGKVVEKGSHDELIDDRGYYHSLFYSN